MRHDSHGFPPAVVYSTVLLSMALLGRMPGVVSKGGGSGASGQESVVLAAFENRHAAERMLASLGHEFRKKARQGDAAALVVSGNKDGSLKVTQSRVVTASGLGAAVIGVTVATLAGLLGTLSAFKGAKTTVHGAHKRESRVGSDEHAAHAILAKAGPSAAIALVRCKDPDTRQAVAARAADRASDSWDGSLTEFLADLDPGSKHDWVRSALDEPSSTSR